MRRARYLLLVLAEGALFLTLVWLTLGLVAGFFVFGPSRPPAAPSAGQLIALTAVVLLPVGVSAWWIFRKLGVHYPKREARAVTISSATISLLCLPIAIPLAQIPGAYAGYLGKPFALVGALVSIAAVIAFATYSMSALLLWFMHRFNAAE